MPPIVLTDPDTDLRALQDLVRLLYARLRETDRAGFDAIYDPIKQAGNADEGYTIANAELALLDAAKGDD